MKSLLNIIDFTTSEINDLIDVAIDIKNNPDKYNERCKNKILATLFFEPSTRTRLSFESAMLSLGGNVIGFSSASNSSVSKGESLADTITVVSGYCDIIAMRHPKEGSSYVASKHSMVPLINAGDGGHFHPTQTLADLCTIKSEKGRLDNLTIGICGDLKYGRTVHSLIDAMVRYKNTKFVLISPKELAIPDFIKKNVLDKNNVEYIETSTLEDSISSLDILYMTRIQKERFSDIDEYERLKDSYVLTSEKMSLAKDDMYVLHPLPRVNEISVDVDSDKRASYFRQTVYGKYMRMALILKLLNNMDEANIEKESFKTDEVCKNERCILTEERELERKCYIDENGIKRCLYCDSIL